MNCRMPLITAQIFLIVGVSYAVAVPQQVSVDKRALQEALSGGQFDVRERELNALQEAFQKGERDDRLVEQAFAAFASTNPLFDERLTAWVEMMP